MNIFIYEYIHEYSYIRINRKFYTFIATCRDNFRGSTRLSPGNIIDG